MTLGRWDAFVRSDSALQVGRVAQYWGKSPSDYLMLDGEIDAWDAIAIDEAIMYRIIVDERQRAEEQAKKEEFDRIKAAPHGSLPRVNAPHITDNWEVQ